MVAARFVFLAAAVSVVASLTEENVFTTLLKRQEPGTPEYNCHDNCGQAITISKSSSDVCNDEAFKSDYDNCLQCSGPDNVNIWKYYGGTLSEVAERCGLSTEPLSGEQPDVGPATSTGSSSSSTGAFASSTAAGSTGTAISSAAATTTSSTASISGAPTTSGNGTASYTTSAPAEQTTNAALYLEPPNAVAMMGAMAMGIAYGIGS